MKSADEEQTLATSVSAQSTIKTNPSTGLAAGEHVGRYVLLKKLGAGGMGVVYEAYDPELERKVALKQITLPRFADSSSTSMTEHAHSLLIAEAQSQAKLVHPNVVSVYDVGRSPYGVYMAMELIPGETIATWLKKCQPSWRTALAIFLQAAAGLAAAHDIGLVHRDFKPDNVLLGLDGRVRIADFGLAIAVHQSQGHRTLGDSSQERSGIGMGAAGTFSYMAPEQHRGDNVSARSDLYSFCVSLYEAIYGARPYRGETREDIVRAIEGRQITSQRRSTRVPSWLAAILWRGLSPQAEDRYASMHEVIVALEEGMARRPAARLLVGIVGVLVFAVMLVGWPKERNIRADMCRQAALQALAFWSPATWQAVEEAFVATDLPYAQDAAATVARIIERRLEDWSSLYLTTCEQEKDDSTHRALAVKCLDEQAAELSALVKAYQRAGPSHVQSAAQILNGLEPVERCRRRDAATFRQEIPAKLQDLPAFLTLGQDVRAAFISERLVKGEARDRELQSLIERASSPAGTPALLARIVGKVADHAADAFAHQKARMLSDRATLLAESANEAETTAMVMHIQASVRGYKLADLERASELYPLAQAHLRRQGNDSLLAARVCVMSVPYLTRTDRYEQAESCLRQAARILDRELGPRHIDTIRALEYLAVTLAFVESNSETQELFVKVAGLYGDVLGPSHPTLANTMANLATSSMELGNLPLSLDYWNKAQWITEQGTVQPDLALAIYIFSATSAQRSGFLQRALHDNQRCIDFARQQANPIMLGWSWVCRVQADVIHADQGDLSVCDDIEPAIAEIARVPIIGRFREDIRLLAFRDLAALAWTCGQSLPMRLAAEIAKREQEAQTFFGPLSPLANNVIDDLFIQKHGLEVAREQLSQRLARFDLNPRLADRLQRLELRKQLVAVLLDLEESEQALRMLQDDRLARLQAYGTSMAANWQFELLLARAYLQGGSPEKALEIVQAIQQGLEDGERTVVADAVLWAVQARAHQAIDPTHAEIERELAQARQLAGQVKRVPIGLARLLDGSL